jgi:hypothetical protein
MSTKTEQFVREYIAKHDRKKAGLMLAFTTLMTFAKDGANTTDDKVTLTLIMRDIGQALGLDPKDLLQFLLLTREAAANGEDPARIGALLYAPEETPA